jgi:hypothetical protein
MGEYLSPILEGFSSPTMNNAYKEMLQPANQNDSKINSNTAFLQELLQQQTELAASLIQTAQRIILNSQKKDKSEAAYDAAFETDITAPLPNISGTLQGFTLFFFILSYFSLAIVSCVNINQLTGNTMNAVYSFMGFLFMFFILMVLITRFG